MDVHVKPGQTPTTGKSPSGKSKDITVHIDILKLQHLYHDESPVVNAPFEVEMENGKKYKGKLDENGEAYVINLPSMPKRVRYGADAREYQLADNTPNPEYMETFDESDADALVKKAMRENGIK